MENCKHNHLLLLSETRDRLRCRHCHLTITKEELGGSFCPECYEADGRKRYEFDTMADSNAGVVRYRCEDCGILITNGDPS